LSRFTLRPFYFLSISDQEKKTMSELSTGNPAPAPIADPNAVASAPVPETVKVQVIERTVSPNSFVVTVEDVDPTFYKNPRKVMLESAIQEMQHSLRTHGQGQEVQVAKIDGSALLGVFAGYTRTEAQTRNVYSPLITKWNKEKNVAAGDPSFLLVSNRDHRALVKNAYPEEFKKELNKEGNKLRVIINDNVKSPGQARMLAAVENFHRTDMPIQDQVDTIEDLIADGYKAKEVATKLKKSEGTISQFRKIAKISGKLTDILTTPDDGETLTEADLTSIKELAVHQVEEFNKRLGLARDDMQAIPFSHAREFATRVVVDGGVLPLRRKHYDELLCNLIGMDPKSHKFQKDKSPENYGLWLAKMNNFAAETTAWREGKGKPQAASDAPVDGAKAEGEVGATTGTVEGLAAQQVSTGNTDAAATTPTTDAKTPATTTAQAPAGDGSTTPTAPKADVVTDAKIAEMTGGSASDIDDDVEPEDQQPAGAKSTKSQIAPSATLKVKDANTILGSTKTYAAQAQEEGEATEDDRSLGRIAAALGAATFGYEMLDDVENHDRYLTATETYVEALENYILALETYAEQAAKGKGKPKPFDGERPTLVIEMPEGEDAFAGAGADDKGIPELDGDEDELADDNAADAEIERLTGGAQG